MLKYLKNIFTPKQQHPTQIKVDTLLKSIVQNSYYDTKTNTLVINTPTNLILKSKGSIMNISEEGYIINIADEIHLNPELSEQTMINIRKIDRQFDDVMEPLSKSIEVLDGNLSV